MDNNLTEAHRWLDQAQHDVYTAGRADEAVSISHSILDAVACHLRPTL